MYKYMLCWRYLKTRYIALASIISVTLGVATMIVVNSVMAGFSNMMRERLHGILADVVVESRDFDGFRDAERVMEEIRRAAGEDVAAMAATMDTVGIMKIELPNGRSLTRQVNIIGVRPEEKASTGDFAEFLFRQDGTRAAPSFEVTEEIARNAPRTHASEADDFAAEDEVFSEMVGESARNAERYGAIVGHALATHLIPDRGEFYLCPEGSEITLTFMRGGRQPGPGHSNFTVVGYFKSGMSEYDSMMVYVPLERLQRARNLGDGQGRGAVNQIQVKLRRGADLDATAARIQKALDPGQAFFVVSTWEQKQGPLLAAVALEQGILNILLFLIIAVAGFGILAIFSMIVVEKTRDIGILKALGASTAGVRGIFLGYGLLLGLVGSGAGMAMGLAFVANINAIEKMLSRLTGRKVFDDQIYYFSEIPTQTEPLTVLAIVIGALSIAVLASVWPAQRAATLHPVRALRYE